MNEAILQAMNQNEVLSGRFVEIVQMNEQWLVSFVDEDERKGSFFISQKDYELLLKEVQTHDFADIRRGYDRYQ